MTVAPLREDDLDAVAAMLARAFHDDPLSRYVKPDPEHRAATGPAHFAAAVRAVRADGEVWVTGDLSAAACWRRPGAHHVTPEQAAAAGLDRVPEIIGEEANARLRAVFAYVRPRVDALAPPSHWYLMLLGVEPARQGHGLGAEVLAPVLARADADRLPCWLETVDPRNVSFYRRQGFDVVEDGVEPGSGLRYLLMRRDPR